MSSLVKTYKHLLIDLNDVKLLTIGIMVWTIWPKQFTEENKNKGNQDENSADFRKTMRRLL